MTFISHIWEPTKELCFGEWTEFMKNRDHEEAEASNKDWMKVS